ncbi:transient receptor potential channel pyrexia-like [Planococcus citri]|uniref:transient receptor potential channel pyrexia-like n=1 Tax=Planococcus citri TaxID=170843 RepID=UPI0031F7A767
MLRRESKTNDNIEFYETRINNVRQSIKQRLRSLRKRSKNESPLEYFPMDFINEEKSDSCSMSTEVMRNDIKQKLLDAVRYLGVHDAFQTMESGDLNIDTYKNASRTVKNLAFLWAAFIGRLDCMQTLHELGADVGFSYETDNFNALHLAAFFGSGTCCEWLLSKRCQSQETSTGLLPVHFAALGNSRCCIEILMQYGSKLPDTVLNSAVNGNSVECVELLLSLNVDVNSFDKEGMTPLHIAADQGSIYCLKCLLSYPLCDKDLKTNDERRYTAVHLAAENGYDQCIQSLAETGADLNEVNAKKETPLHLACKMQYPDCVDVLLKNHANVNAQNNDERTPLHCAVAKSRLALLIVQKLVEWHADVNASDWYGFTPLHIAALNELDECVEYLIMSGSNVAAKTKAGLSALNVINRKTPVSVSKIPRRLNLSLAYNAEQSLKFSFRDIITNSQIGEVDFLYTLQKEGQSCVLKHPLCRAFLHLKWEKVRPYYLLRVGISTVAIVVLSFYIMLASINRCCDEKEPNSNCTELNADALKNRSDEFIFLTELHNQPFVINTMKVIILLLVFLNITKIFFSLAAYKSARHYFSKQYNILELSLIAGIFMLCLTTDTQFRRWWQCIMGAMTVLFCWVYLMIMVGQMPSYGAYVSMFTKVLQEFSKLLVAYFCVLIGFTITLCVLFPDHEVLRNPLLGFVKVMAMMTGELNLDDLVGTIKAAHIKFTVFFILALFIIFVTVVLMNLLVGIAVHDVEGLHKTADLTKLVHQTQLIHFLELACFNGFFPKKISDIFQNFLYVSPRMYRVVIYVRPLNPQEKRLPREIMEDGLKIALDRSKARSMKNNSKQDMESRIDSLEKQIKNLQTLMNEIGNNVKNLVK